MGFRAQARRAAVALCASVLAVRAARAECKAWPGEPDPLQTTSSVDELAAHFAQLRAAELASFAARIEPSSPGAAHRLWLHVSCLDPARPDASQGAERTAPVRIHSPEAVRGSTDPPLTAPDVASAFARLDEPISVSPSAGVGPAAAHPSPRVRASVPAVSAGPRTTRPRAHNLLAVDGLLEQADEFLRQARFEEAIDRAAKARDALPPKGSPADLRARRSRADVITGTAQVALGKDADARASFERAVRSEPDLRLDSAKTSPKVLRAFDAARSAAEEPAQ